MYISPLKLEFFRKENGYNLYLLKKPLKVIYDEDKDIKSLEVPINFCTDLTSVPKPFNKWVKRSNPKYAKPSIIHDYLYTETKRYTRLFADNMFYKCMKHEGTPLRYRIPFYLMVRTFGWLRYGKNTTKN